MKLFKTKSKEQPLVVSPPPSSRVEVEVHKNASEHAAKKARETNQHLNELLVENGFTLKIYLAAGGQPQRKVGNKK